MLNRPLSAPFKPGPSADSHRGYAWKAAVYTDQYCTCYMVGARGDGEISAGSNHLGLRCVKPEKQARL